ncbi:MAG TPA: YqgE/AlgH family protein [Cyclobacteriaceae bacterium]|nr:YqgE/AlgH family protein [Cyclobacteriaceae bacterium]
MSELNFFNYKNQIKPAKGRLLISEPFLPDPNFERTVVLLCEHNEEGSFGFVLNKPSLIKVSEVMEDVKNLHEQVFVGGPVQQDTLHFIHRNTAVENTSVILDGIYWGGSVESLLLLDDTQQLSGNDIRFFLGYSGWGPGQLESELDEESWIVCDYVTQDLLFDTDPKMMWKKALDDMGGRFSLYSNYPVDPRLN